jgi:hypothetical protein
MLSVLAGCADVAASGATDETAELASSLKVVPAQICPLATPRYQAKAAYSFPEIGGLRVLVAPAQPGPADELFVLVEATGATVPSSITVRFSSDGWKSSQDRALALWCPPGTAAGTVFGISPGRFSSGTELQMALFYDSNGHRTWLNNHASNYRLQVRDPAPLQWVGDLTAGKPSQTAPWVVSVQTYPMRAAKTVELHWANEDYSHLEQAPLTLVETSAGGYGNDDRWQVLVPAGQFTAKQALHYWVRATDFAGQTLWDSRNGANYSATVGP